MLEFAVLRLPVRSDESGDRWSMRLTTKTLGHEEGKKEDGPEGRRENLPSGGYAIADDFRVRSVKWVWPWSETSSAVAMHGKRDGSSCRWGDLGFGFNFLGSLERIIHGA